jgi:hypothetical protein
VTSNAAGDILAQGGYNNAGGSGAAVRLMCDYLCMCLCLGELRVFEAKRGFDLSLKKGRDSTLPPELLRSPEPDDIIIKNLASSFPQPTFVFFISVGLQIQWYPMESVWNEDCES